MHFPIPPGGERPGAIENTMVMLDEQGMFKQTFVGPYQGESLNLNLNLNLHTDRAGYGISVDYSKINVEYIQ